MDLIAICEDLMEIEPMEIVLPEVTLSVKRLYKSQMTSYYYQTSIRTYYLFEHFGVDQIFRTKILSLPKIRNLKSCEFKQLLTLDLAGAQS